MVFSSIVFLIYFLPAVWLGSFLFQKQLKLQNVFLLGMSLLFYSWADSYFVLLMLVSISANYIFGLLIDSHTHRKLWLTVGLSVNILLLSTFKYADFIIGNINTVLSVAGFELPSGHLALPVGISFFTFQAMSYIVDVYRRETSVQRNPLDLGLYISLFPQLIAGPIVRYHNIAAHIQNRPTTLADTAYGIRRFIIGLGKKILIANICAESCDMIFAMPNDQITTKLAWIAVLTYTIQIYFDFSGYSDMAIGLGRILGFHFEENFNYPYIAGSIQDFWRRWHISLSKWFRDYLYIPLGGSRGATSRTYFNLLLVFLLCGLWHGASWNFAIWGLYHGFFLILERIDSNRILGKLGAFRHVYVLLVVMVGWLLFRAESFEQFFVFLKAMFAGGAENKLDKIFRHNYELVTMIIVAIYAALPHFRLRNSLVQSHYGRDLYLLAVFMLSLVYLSGNTYSPFIYFRF
jgi:alginate O-acetyltransferase complex protein AlgI